MLNYLFYIIALLPLLILLSVKVISNISISNRLKYIGNTLLGTSVLVAVSFLFSLYWSNSNVIIGYQGLLNPLRIDSLSITMFLMVSIIGFVVVRFSNNYLAGDPREHTFIRRLFTTIAFVQIFVLSGNLLVLFLTWVATSISLHFLIIYNTERLGARRAVEKKFLLARMSDLFLLAGLIFLYIEFDTLDLGTIIQGFKTIQLSDLSSNLEFAGAFLAIAAVIKSVQIPFHGWILDVMEAPTPISSLLHAGLLNAGPFLIIRFSYLMDFVTIGPIILLVVGGLSALFGTIVFPSQPSIKTSLAYSSIGHMGFSLMLCGMGLYSASLLHLIAHSFYKAHSFLSSGAIIDKHRLQQLNGEPSFKLRLGNVISGFLITCLLYFLVTKLWGGFSHYSFQFLILGAIIILGVASYLIRTSSLDNGISTVFKSITISGFVIASFFLCESAIGLLIGDQLPLFSDRNILVNGASLLFLALYMLAVFLPMLGNTNSTMTFLKWQVYKRNGFYIHTLFDRFIHSNNPRIKRKKYTI